MFVSSFLLLLVTVSSSHGRNPSPSSTENEEFIRTFNFSPWGFYCYKIYESDQDITPQNCLDDSTPEICQMSDPKTDCWALFTKNNETILIGCGPYDENTHPEACLKNDTTFGDDRTAACVVQLSDQCVGTVTPSGLKIVFGCRVCIVDGTEYQFDLGNVVNSRQRKFLKSYLAEFYEGKHQFLSRSSIIYAEPGEDFSKSNIYPFWLPNTNCYGLELDTNETVILECTDEKAKKPGCLTVTDKDGGKSDTICAKAVNKECAGFVTPKNSTVYLDCFKEERFCERTGEMCFTYGIGHTSYKECYSDLFGYRENETALAMRIEVFKSQNHSFFDHGYQWGKDPEHISCLRSDESYVTERLHGHGSCFGLVNDNFETIVLECPNQKTSKPGCYNIYTSNYGPDKKLIDSSQTEHESCLQDVGGSCIGIVTPSGWKLLLSCKAVVGWSPVVSVPGEPEDMF